MVQIYFNVWLLLSTPTVFIFHFLNENAIRFHRAAHSNKRHFVRWPCRQIASTSPGQAKDLLCNCLKSIGKLHPSFRCTFKWSPTEITKWRHRHFLTLAVKTCFKQLLKLVEGVGEKNNERLPNGCNWLFFNKSTSTKPYLTHAWPEWLKNNPKHQIFHSFNTEKVANNWNVVNNWN